MPVLRAQSTQAYFMVSREDENCIHSTIVFITILRRGTAFSWTSALVSLLFFCGKVSLCFALFRFAYSGLSESSSRS